MVSVALVLIVLSPIVENWKEEPKDGFPLSYYPMFTMRRSAELRLTHVIGIDDRGETTPLHYRLTGLGGGLNSSRKQIRKMVRFGGAKQLCANVSANIGALDKPELGSIREVRVITGKYLLDGFFRGQTEPTSEKVHATCAVSLS